jgi:hypothetical protein
MTRAELHLWYGESDVGKTAQLGRAAQYHFDRTGEISRLVSADSGWQSIDEKLIWSEENPNGIIEAWNVQALQDPWAVLIATTEGEWPKVIVAPDGRPRLRMSKPKFKDGRIVGAGDRIVGQYFYEGLSTLGNTGLQDHIRTQRVIGQDVVGKFTSTMEEADGDKALTRTLSFAKAAPSHYAQVQDFLLLDLVPRTGSMPVARVVWTAHEAKGRDDITGIENSVLGPATVGKATVDRTVQKFAHAFHLTSETSFTGDKNAPTITRAFRAWFVKHPDVVLTRMSWPTKISLDLEQSAELLRKFPGGFIPLTRTEGIEVFFSFLAGSAAKGAK